MSTADSFISFENFSAEDVFFGNRRRWGSVVTESAFYDYVDITIQEAYQLYFNLEDFEVVTTGSKSTASIDWTTTFGSTESLPFTPTSTVRQGAYYTALGNPAQVPKARVFVPLFSDGSNPFRHTTNGIGPRLVDFRLVLGGSPSSSMIRLFYYFAFYHSPLPSTRMIVANPNGARVSPPSGSLITGTPPSSGTISILGVSLNWVGGGVNAGAWASETATCSATSSAFTY